MKIITIFLALFFLSWLVTTGRDLTAEITVAATPANLSRTINESDLQSGIGSDLIPDYYSSADAVSIHDLEGYFSLTMFLGTPHPFP